MTFNPAPKNPYKKRKPTRKKRGEFSKETRDKIMEDYNHACAVCKRKATQIHHVMPKGSGKGRGVYTNGLPVCNDCHRDIHQENKKLKYWKQHFITIHGPDYFRDDWD